VAGAQAAIFAALELQRRKFDVQGYMRGMR
jgi:hypothetical protein